jgi:hypothetical protein
VLYTAILYDAMNDSDHYLNSAPVSNTRDSLTVEPPSIHPIECLGWNFAIIKRKELLVSGSIATIFL